MPTQEGLAQEQGFRSSFFGFDKNDVLAYMNALAEENQRQSGAYQEQIRQLQAQVDRLTGEQNAARLCVDKLQQDLAQANERADTAEKQLAEAEAETEAQTARYRTAQDSLNRAQLHCRDLEQEILRLQQQVEAEKNAAAGEMAQAGIAPADPLADARLEARRILADARLYAENAEKRLQQEADAQKQRMAEHAAGISAGVLLLRGRLTRVDDKLGAAVLDLENATAAIYEALDQADADLDALGAHMRAYAGGHPEIDPVPPADPAPRARATAQPVPPRPRTGTARPLRRPGRLRRTVSRELRDAMTHFDETE